jgi:ribosomal-protein-alanine N-acetyltransferase
MKMNFQTFPVLKTERLTLRNFRRKDIENIYKIRTCKDVMKYMDAHKMESLEEAERFLNYTLKTHREGQAINWIITLKGSDDMIGYVGFWRVDKSHYRSEIGYALNKKFWNMGIMSEAIKESLKYGFENMGLNSIEANVNPINTASLKLLEKCGFKKEGYFRENYYFDGKFIDTVTFSMIKKDYYLRSIISSEKDIPKDKFINELPVGSRNLP